MTRARLVEILAQELERAELHPSAAKHIVDLREGKHGPGIEAALRAKERAVREGMS